MPMLAPPEYVLNSAPFWTVLAALYFQKPTAREAKMVARALQKLTSQTAYVAGELKGYGE